MGKMFETMMQSGRNQVWTKKKRLFKNAQNIVNNGGAGTWQALKTQYERKQMRDKLKNLKIRKNY